MKKISLFNLMLAAAVTVLAGCSESSSGGATASITAADLAGTWVDDCENDTSSSSIETTIVISGNTIELTTNVYDVQNCAASPTMTFNESWTFTLGGSCPLDGTVAGFTTGTQFDAEVTASDFPGRAGTMTYDCIVLSAYRLYVGDEDADPAKDGSSADKRPVTLYVEPLIRV